MNERSFTIPATLAVVGVLLLGACSGGESSPVETVQGSWRLTTMTVDDVAHPLDGPRAKPLTMVVDGVIATGSAGCNAWGANVTEDGDTLDLQDLAQTAIGCRPSLVATENAFMEGLAAVSSATLEDDGLVLSGDGVELVFEVAPAPDVQLSGRWDLVHLTDGDTDYTFASGGPSLVLLGNQANSGCQVNSVRADVDGNAVRLDVLGTSYMRSCPPGSEDFLDGDYPDYLRRVEHGERHGDRLALTGDDLTLTYELHHRD